jgi:hypothetical protein
VTLRLLLPIVLVALGGAFLLLREQRAAHAPLLPLTFAHADHGEVNCTRCHHEFVDATPRGPCIECHKQDPALARRIEADFHGLCRGCHLERQLAGLDSGPTRACSACHQGDSAP